METDDPARASALIQSGPQKERGTSTSVVAMRPGERQAEAKRRAAAIRAKSR